jgi:putative transposase
LALLERDAPSLPVSTQAALLDLNRTSLYYQPQPPSAADIALKHRIDAIYTESPFYGARRIAAQLQRDGMPINWKTVGRHMREMGIVGLAPGPTLSRPHPTHPVYPYLLRHITAAHPNHIWGTDITYVRLRHGWMYLVVMLDWYSRYVVSWALDDTLALPFVLQCVESALVTATPEIVNSDQGSHFTTPQYLERLTQAGVRISMDGKGRALDNIFTERLWRTVKYENVYPRGYTTPREVRQGLDAYFDFYNHRRLHQALNYQPPAAVYAPSGA